VRWHLVVIRAAKQRAAEQMQGDCRHLEQRLGDHGAVSTFECKFATESSGKV
jgi:hypothetical protein